MEEIVNMAGMVLVAVLFLAFIVWREREHQRQVDALTSKIMAKNYVEFATYRPEETRAEDSASLKQSDEPAKPKQPFDPVLGRNY